MRRRDMDPKEMRDMTLTQKRFREWCESRDGEYQEDRCQFDNGTINTSGSSVSIDKGGAGRRGRDALITENGFRFSPYNEHEVDLIVDTENGQMKVGKIPR